MIRFNFCNRLQIFDTTEGYAMTDEASGRVFWGVQWPTETVFDVVHERLSDTIDPHQEFDLEWESPEEEW